MIEGVTYTTDTSSTTSTSSSSSSTESLDKDDFLTLLVTQLENQDPLDPMDNSEFVAQLAQFSTLEGITNLGESMDGLVDSMSSMQKYSMSSLIDKTVKYEGYNFSYSGSSVDLGYSLDADASSVTVKIYDSSGNLVNTYDMGSQNEGSYDVTWDGTDSSGATVSSGTYKMTVSATDSSGSSVDTTTYVSGKVSSVMYDSDGTTELTVDSETITPDEILGIY